MRSWVVRVLGLLAAALTIVLLLAAPASAAQRPRDHVPGPVVVIGIPGLTWQNVDKLQTPTLWRLAGHGSAGAMTARVVDSLTCPSDAWLTIGAGARALRPPLLTRQQVKQRTLHCAPYPEISGAHVDKWPKLRRANANSDYGTRLGQLAAILRKHGECIGASGQGALLGSAGPDGAVSTHRGRMSDLPSIVRACPLTFVDAGHDHVSPAAADVLVGNVLGSLPRNATVLVLGTSDRHDYAQMHVAIAHGPTLGKNPFAGRWLGSRSTRRTDIVQLTDVTPTLLQLLGHSGDQTSQMDGTPVRANGTYDEPTAAVVDKLRSIDQANKISRDLTPPFVTILEVGQLLIYIIAAIALRRQWSPPAKRRRVLRLVRLIALLGASVPPATFLANLVPWWYAPHPVPALIGICAAFVAGIMVVALGGPWRRHVIGPPAIVAGASGIVLGVDVMTGSNMQLSSLLGYPVVIGARFYGFGNNMFALFSTGVLILLAALYHWLRRHIRRSVTLAVVGALGAFAVALDGWPAWGSDFGGVLALVPGVAVLVLLLMGRRLSISWLAGICVGGVIVIGFIAYLDYRKPPSERSHLGRFFGQVLNGDAWPIIWRKLSANVHILASNYGLSLLVVVGVLFLAFVLMRPVEWHAAALQRVFEVVPEFRAALMATLVTLVIGAAVNDSSIAIPAMGMIVAIPVAVAASARVLERDDDTPASTCDVAADQDSAAPTPVDHEASP